MNQSNTINSSTKSTKSIKSNRNNDNDDNENYENSFMSDINENIRSIDESFAYEPYINEQNNNISFSSNINNISNSIIPQTPVVVIESTCTISDHLKVIILLILC